MKLSAFYNNKGVKDAYIAKNNSMHGAGSCMIRIVNSDKGKRISLSAALYKNLGEPKIVGVVVHEGKIYIHHHNEGVPVSNSHTIYNSDLIDRITKELKLDFSTKSSVSLQAVLDNDEETNEVFATVTK